MQRTAPGGAAADALTGTLAWPSTPSAAPATPHHAPPRIGRTGIRADQRSMTPYQPFIDKPRDLARFRVQRDVVLRPFGDVVDEFDRVKGMLENRFQNLPISYVARPHLTLAGSPAGTRLEPVSRLVASLAVSVRPLRIRVEALGHVPFRIVIVRVQRTPELSDALGGLRRRLDSPGARPATANEGRQYEEGMRFQ